MSEATEVVKPKKPKTRRRSLYTGGAHIEEALINGEWVKTGRYWQRPIIDGDRTWKLLEAGKERMASLEAKKNTVDHAMSKTGATTSPFRKALIFRDACEQYIKEGC